MVSVKNRKLISQVNLKAKQLIDPVSLISSTIFSAIRINPVKRSELDFVWFV
jgi:hypothetical protein